MKTTQILILLTLSAISLSACASPEAADASKNSNAQPSAELIKPAETTPAASSTPASVGQPGQTPFSPSTPASSAAPTPPAQPLPPDALPRLVVPIKKIDFGKQPKGKSLARSIVIKNTGKSDLKIESVQPSCGCTTVDYPKVIAPGKSGSIKLKVDTGQSPGNHTKSVTIKSNDPVQSSVKVDLAFTVK